jgi:hypothetical protein
MVRLGSNPDESGSADGSCNGLGWLVYGIFRLFFKGIREPFGVALFWLPFLVTAQKVVVKRLSFDFLCVSSLSALCVKSSSFFSQSTQREERKDPQREEEFSKGIT